MRISVLVLLWPLIEIALFVTAGGAIGLGWTLLVILGTAVLGIWLLRSRGVRSAAEMRRGLQVVSGGLGKLAGDVLVMLAAVLLILPGFLTDAVGLLLLIPPVRALIMLWVARKVSVHMRPQPGQSSQSDASRRDMIIDGDFIELDPDQPPRPSGWTRH